MAKYKPGPVMGKPDVQTRKTGDAKEGTEAQFFAEGTISALERECRTGDPDNEDPDADENPDIEAIDTSTWARNEYGLLVPPDEACSLSLLRCPTT